MIIVQLKGGLGNQMFQYAFGRSMALFHNTSLKIDVNYFENQDPGVTPRKYELDVFDLKQSYATNKEIQSIQQQYPNWIQKSIGKLLPRFRPVFKEKNEKYIKSIFFALNNVYFKGYWQNEKYFKNIEILIREEFSFKHPLSQKAKSLLEEIGSNESVSLHIRRTDYIGKAVGEVCTPGYYKKAIQHIEDLKNNIRLYVFSDDIEWVRSNLAFSHPTIFVDKTYTENIDWMDMQLMSKCKHNIIANSSFSWWAAWLNDNPKKIVIAPNEWNFKKNINDIIPPEWITI